MWPRLQTVIQTVRNRVIHLRPLQFRNLKFTQVLNSCSQHVNNLTGYSKIEQLKVAITTHERLLKDKRSLALQARKAYLDAVQKRSNSQREVNELLQRQSSWSPTDLERFTALYRNDHSNKTLESDSQKKMEQAEEQVDEAQDSLVQAILTRYHEEQVWSDKIRRASTWGTWGLMGINLILFVVVQLILEPKKRRRWLHQAMVYIDKENKSQYETQSLQMKKLESMMNTTQHSAPDSTVKTLPHIDEPSEKKNKDVSVSSYNTFTEFVGECPRISFTSWSTFLNTIHQVFNYIFSPDPLVFSQKQFSTYTAECALLGSALTSLLFLLLQNKSS
ncbi:inner membrane protein [Schizosaccharomyces japonicus yFS275]|uniref:Sensitive to high expression protein 9, mitochondrial n=1 Tax=Schizosaccharomyces japonicus (strain yFS275 / FY16936) TaxID=402676 RepID=B6K885_SCHJY|nr:inner membrane protein [Schizosaccharomyces japonicus yFS275]EEB09739.1 inner membrane protein [Schizosaccharomyces japonicus yFS275]